MATTCEKNETDLVQHVSTFLFLAAFDSIACQVRTRMTHPTCIEPIMENGGDDGKGPSTRRR